MINADNIAIGSIGSMRYGDIINTKEVYADRFIGTALPEDSAESFNIIEHEGETHCLRPFQELITGQFMHKELRCKTCQCICSWELSVKKY